MPSLLDRNFKYVPSTQTNVRETFRRHGWIGPEERRSGRHMVVQVQHIEAPPPPAHEPPVYGLGWGNSGVIFG